MEDKAIVIENINEQNQIPDSDIAFTIKSGGDINMNLVDGKKVNIIEPTDP